MEVIRVPMGKSNAYLIKGKSGFILVDAGISNKHNKILNALNKFNADFNDINLIIITHAHSDHVGSLYDIKIKSNALVLVHEKEKDILNKGYCKFPKGTMLFSKIISSASNNFFFSQNKFKSVEADIVINDNYDLSKHGVDGKIIHTPGHTEGSISIILENNQCVVGDTLFNMFPNSVYPPFANDEKELIESQKKLRRENCIKYYPGHGKEFSLDKFDKAIKNISNL